MQTAFLFPGQGSQFAGMGKSLAQTFPSARAVFEEADQTLGFELSRLCFEGPEEALRLTENTQPAILTVSVAAPGGASDGAMAETRRSIAGGCSGTADRRQARVASSSAAASGAA